MYKYNPNIYTANLNDKCIDKAIEHAKKEFPNESCGAIIDEEYIKFENTSDNKEDNFIIEDELFYKYYMKDEVKCLIHSHNDFNQVSLQDQIQQRELNIPSLIINLRQKSLMDCIVFGDTLPIAPLVGRPFFYGAFDCISLINDYFRLNFDISLPNPPREWAFWMKGKSMFEEHLDNVPFKEVNINDIKKHDVLLYNINGVKYINHIAVVVSDKGEVLHHIHNNLSGTYPINYNKKYLRTVMRLNINKDKE